MPGENHMEAASGPQSGIDLDAAAVGLDNFMTDRKSKPSSIDLSG